MRVVVQRVSSARVDLDDGSCHSKIGPGMLVLLGVARGDGQREAEFLAKKVSEVRIFPDETGKMNLDVTQAQGEILVVSQFTLCADLRRGRRPSFEKAMAPEEANELYLRFVDLLRQRGLVCQTGSFGAHMQVGLVNDGPVTLILDSPE